MPTEFSPLSIDELLESIFPKNFNYEKHSSFRRTRVFSIECKYNLHSSWLKILSLQNITSEILAKFALSRYIRGKNVGEKILRENMWGKSSAIIRGWTSQFPYNWTIKDRITRDAHLWNRDFLNETFSSIEWGISPRNIRYNVNMQDPVWPNRDTAAVASADKRCKRRIDDFSSRSARSASDALKFYRSLFNEDTARNMRDALNHWNLCNRPRYVQYLSLFITGSFVMRP